MSLDATGRPVAFLTGQLAAAPTTGPRALLLAGAAGLAAMAVPAAAVVLPHQRMPEVSLRPEVTTSQLKAIQPAGADMFADATQLFARVTPPTPSGVLARPRDARLDIEAARTAAALLAQQQAAAQATEQAAAAARLAASKAAAQMAAQAALQAARVATTRREALAHERSARAFAPATVLHAEEVVATVVPHATLTSQGAEAVAIAKGYLGVPYRYGGSSPSGFDCSGLVQYAYARLGVQLPRTAAEQAAFGTRVYDPEPGDLVAFVSAGHVFHIGIYLGGHMMIAAPHTGEDVQEQAIWSTSIYFVRV